MTGLRFFIDEESGLPLCESGNEAYRALGEWVLTDISTMLAVCLDALAMIDDVAHGRDPFADWSSEVFEVTFAPEAVSLHNLWAPGVEGTYAVGEVAAALEDYWALLRTLGEGAHLRREFRPDLPAWEASLLMWEESWRRPHPYRGRLF